MCQKILFADDDPLMQRLYQHHLESAGFKLIAASTGREAVEAAGREKPRLAIVDFLMPEMDGLSAMQELKKAEATRAIPVILITADPNCYRYKRQFTDAGAAGFLTKPFSPAQLLETIRRLLPSVHCAA
jgi:two-component system chemotaxis response regulator CheY